jgi:uncharacterized protein (DUF1697 family)
MTTYISLLRGINVSGQKKIQMTALKEIYEEMNFSNIQTFIQSGNVVFQYIESDPHDLALMISLQIQKRFGFYVSVIVLTTSEMNDIVENNPFLTDVFKKMNTNALHFWTPNPWKLI